MAHPLTSQKKAVPSWLAGLFTLAFLFLLIEFFDELHYGIQGAVLPSLRDSLGLSYAQIGLLLGLPGILGNAIEPVIMLLGDTALRKRLVLGGGLAIALAALLIASGPPFPLLVVAFIIAFPASGAFVTLSQATLMDLNSGRQPQMMARWTVFGAFGNLLGPLAVAGLFALGLSWRAPYILVSVLALGLALLVALVRFPQPAVRADSGAGGTGGACSTGAAWNILLRDLLHAVNNWGLMRWLLLLIFSDLMLDVFVSYSTLYYADVAGLAPAQVSLVLAALMAAGLANNLFLIPILDHFPGRRVVRLSALLAGILYTAFLLVPGVQAKVLLGIAVHFSTLGWYEVLQGEAYAALPGRSGTVMAINSVMSVLGAALVWFVGWFASQAGLPAAMWLLLAGPLALLLFLPRSEKG
jgi:MFS transporter, FSR family, fosmidomycin resistance protein